MSADPRLLDVTTALLARRLEVRSDDVAGARISSARPQTGTVWVSSADDEEP